jgi:RNA polymerase sigma-70 factor (ECF subfamily)
MSDSPAESPSKAPFPTTCWSRVVRAGDPAEPGARAALEELCAAYWYPIYALVRHKGHDPDRAADLTQAYFARLLEKSTVAAADPARGRFRAFLLADCRFFLADARDRAGARKRGGGARTFSLDASDAEARYRLEPSHAETPERLFDRAWAMALLDRATAALSSHYAATGRAALFEQLRPALASDPDAPSQAEVGRRLGMTPGAVQVALHRMRARFGWTLRELVAATLDDPSPAAIDEEIRGLFAALVG